MTSQARRCAAAALVAVCTFSRAAWADGADGTAAAASDSEPAPAVALILQLREGSTIDAERLRAAIAGELEAPLAQGPLAPGGTIVVKETDAAVSVSFDSPSGRHEERSVAVPDDGEQAVRDIALLAGNLARDQSAPFIHVALPVPPPKPAPPAPAAPPARGTGGDASPCDRTNFDVPIGLDFAPMVGSSTLAAGRAGRHLSFGVVGTASSGVHGLALSAALNVDLGYVCGAEIAGAINVTRALVGGQVAGGINVAKGTVHGAQLAGGVNVAVGAMSGLQAAGGVNVATGPSKGLQAAGGANVARAIHGFQMAGGVNVARSVEGAQIGGGLNVSGQTSGAQIGVVNVTAGPVHGVQIGVVNVNSDADFALGILNVSTRGRFRLDAWGLPDAGLVLTGVKNGGSHYHYIYGVGIRPDDTHHAWAALGLGAHVTTPFEWLAVDLDGLAYQEVVFGPERNTLFQLRAVVGLRIVPGVTAMVGPTFNLSETMNDLPRGLAPGYSSLIAETSSQQFRAWPGVSAGIEVL
jgi:hypothetical protein